MPDLRQKPYVERPYKNWEYAKKQPLQTTLDMTAARVLYVLDNIEHLQSQNTFSLIVENMIQINQELVSRIQTSPDEVDAFKRVLPFGKKINILQNEILAIIATQVRALTPFPEVTLKTVMRIVAPLLDSSFFSADKKTFLWFVIESYFNDMKKNEKEYQDFDGLSGEKAKKILIENLPKDFYSSLQDYTFQEDIILRVFRGTLIFFIRNPKDYQRVAQEMHAKAPLSSGKYLGTTRNEFFDTGNVILVHGTEKDEDVILHELAHRKNMFVKYLIWATSYDGLEEIFKIIHDEIISFLEEGMEIEGVKDILLDKGGAYNPIPKRRPKHRKNYKELRKFYTKYGERFIDTAYAIKEAFPNMYLSLLAITPIELWKYILEKDNS